MSSPSTPSSGRGTAGATSLPPLRVVRVTGPEPTSGPELRDVHLEVSRPLTRHEQRELARVDPRLRAVGQRLVVRDTTAEQVAGGAETLARLLREVEVEGRAAQVEDEQRAAAHAVRVQAEKDRLAAVLRAIRPGPG